MISKRIRGAAAIIAAAMLWSGHAAQAGPFFSIDSATDELVRFDSTTGAVTVVGALGTDVGDVDLTRTADGRLWGINSIFGDRVDLHEINTTTGAVLSTTQVNLSGIQNAEGLGHSGNQLVIGHSASSSASNIFSELATNGTISNSVTTSIDIDALAAGSGSVPFYALDGALLGQWFSVFHELDPSTPTNPQFASFNTGGEPIGNDLVADDTSIFFLDSLSTPELLSFDFASPTVLNRVALDRVGDYRGLAAGDSLAVTEPGVLLVFASGLLLLGGTRRRRNR